MSSEMIGGGGRGRGGVWVLACIFAAVVCDLEQAALAVQNIWFIFYVGSLCG